jgi:hypothetical protein
MNGGLFPPPEREPDRDFPTESVVKAGRVIFFIPLVIMGCVIGGCFPFPYSILIMACVLVLCGAVAWLWLRALRKEKGRDD